MLTHEQIRAAATTYSAVRAVEDGIPETIYVFWGVEEILPKRHPRFPFQKDGAVEEIAYTSGYVEHEQW